MRLWSTVIYSVLSILSCVHLPPWFHNHEPPICCGVWRAKLVLVCYRPLKATLNEAVMDQDGWPIKHCRSMWARADSRLFDDVSCLLECLWRDLWQTPPIRLLSRVFVLCLLVMTTKWYSKMRCTCMHSSSSKAIFQQCQEEGKWHTSVRVLC